MLHFTDECDRNYLIDILYFHSATFLTLQVPVQGSTVILKKPAPFWDEEEIRLGLTRTLKEKAGHQLFKFYIFHIA